MLMSSPRPHLLIFHMAYRKREGVRDITQRAGQIRATCDMVEVLRLHLLLVRLSVIEIVEVGNNDGHGEGNSEHTSNGAE